MSQFVSEKSVFVNQNLESREALLRFVSDKAAEFGVTDNADAVYDAFMAREAMGETGMTDGFAVPHAKSDDIKDAAVIVVKNATPLEWPSFDEKPVDVAIALLVPGGEAGTDVYDRINDLLGSLHRDFRSPDFPPNCVLITHSLAIRLFVMRWFHLTVEEFEEMASPRNGDLVILEYDDAAQEYRLTTPLARNSDTVFRRRPIRLPDE